MHRKTLIQSLTEIILGTPCLHPLRVAIDGVDAAGKTSLAEELALALQTQPRQVIHTSVDGFHQSKAVRCQLGDLSPEGFYRDSYNYDALIENLLVPLGPGGSLQYRTAVFDVRANTSLDLPFRTAQSDAILLVDGIFLLRPELISWWDLTIFLDVSFETTVARGSERDKTHLGSVAEARERYLKRYVPGQKLYFQDTHPLDKADIVIDNNDLRHPKFIKRPDY